MEIEEFQLEIEVKSLEILTREFFWKTFMWNKFWESNAEKNKIMAGQQQLRYFVAGEHGKLNRL